jgi:hypothetical protein
MKRKALPRLMWWLGYGGLIPFAAMLLVLLAGMRIPFLDSFPPGLVLATYTAVVLTFIGAMHWWVALDIQDGLQGTELGKLLALSLIPTMVAWFSLLLPVNITLFVLAALILLAYYADSVLLFDKIDGWYARMRLHLSGIVALLLVVAGVMAG